MNKRHSGFLTLSGALPIVASHFLLSSLPAYAQTAIDNLVRSSLIPGQATRAQVESALGKPVQSLSGTLSEFAPPPGPRSGKVYVQYGAGTDKAERIEIVLAAPQSKTEAASGLGLGEATSSKANARGKLEEFFDRTPGVVLTHTGADAASSVSRVAYYSPKLFAAAAGSPKTKADTSSTRSLPIPDRGNAALAVTAVEADNPFNIPPGAVVSFPSGDQADAPRAEEEKNPYDGAKTVSISDLTVTYPRPRTPQLNFKWESNGRALDLAENVLTAPYRLECGANKFGSKIGGVDMEAITDFKGYATSKLLGEYDPRMSGECKLNIWLEDVDGNRTNELSANVTFK